MCAEKQNRYDEQLGSLYYNLGSEINLDFNTDSTINYVIGTDNSKTLFLHLKDEDDSVSIGLVVGIVI